MSLGVQYPMVLTTSLPFQSVKDVEDALAAAQYVADSAGSTAIYLSLRLSRPLLVEGEAGCGKTQIAKVLSQILNTELIRLQCYEGLDANSALFEWDYLKQLLTIRIEEVSKNAQKVREEIFGEPYLLKRPLLKALTHEGLRPAVLLVDELDRADEEFEGFLLEFLDEFQVTIPEYGTVKAKTPPVVVITSNRTREIGDGIRRRCLYLSLSYPTSEKELRIIKLKAPHVNEKLAEQVVSFMGKLRYMDDLIKKPGVAETLNWIEALTGMGVTELNEDVIRSTMSCIIKSSDDYRKLEGAALQSLLEKSGDKSANR